ncbi:MAG: zinc-dependent metalloprotease, partial [Phycisphaeraceae bacterium]
MINVRHAWSGRRPLTFLTRLLLLTVCLGGLGCATPGDSEEASSPAAETHTDESQADRTRADATEPDEPSRAADASADDSAADAGDESEKAGDAGEGDADAGTGADSGSDAKPSAGKSSDDGFPALDKVVGDMQPVPTERGEAGLMTLYRHAASARHEDQTTLLARIPSSLLGEDLLVARSLSRGVSAGFMWGDTLGRFVMRGGSVVLQAPNVRYAASNEGPLAEVVERTYRPRILGEMKIKTMVDGDPVVDLADLLLGTTGPLPGVSSTKPDKGLSEYHAIKVFPDNLLIDVDLAMKDGEGFELIGLAYSFRRLPETGTYEPRMADERVGYFTTVRQDWTLGHEARQTVQRYVQRWHLEKQDPTLELSPPKQPIVFVLEDTIPVRWRRYVKAGVLEWNEAFEKIGFADAIEVQQQSEHNLYADIDPADSRYNFIQWITMGRPFGMGPRRVDPRTGQILDADVVIDDAFLRAYQYELEILGRRVADDDPDEPAEIDGGEFDTPESQDHAHGEANGHVHGPHCMHGSAMTAQTSMLRLGADITGERVPERLLGELIKKVVTHEVGHSLGLRHNFKASSWLDLEEIKRRRDQTDLPTSASVMDYSPLLYFAGDDVSELRHITDPGLGPYDHWAIEYGYREVEGQGGGEGEGDNAKTAEEEMLAAIASRSAEPALAYAPDEDTHLSLRPDPYTARWDMGDDPIAWSRSRVELTDELLENFDQWAIDEDEPAYYTRSVFNAVFRQRFSGMANVAKLVSGQAFSRSRAGDPGAQSAFTIIPDETRREAIAFLGETVFASDHFDFDPALLNRLAPVRWKDWATRSVTRLDWPLHRFVLNAQTTPLRTLVSPEVLERMYDAERKVEGEFMSTVEVLERVTGTIWSELGDPPADEGQPTIDSLRRNLQNQHLDFLQNYAEPGLRYYAPSDVHRQVR